MNSVESAALAPPCAGAKSAPVAAPPDAERWDAWDRFLEATPETGFMQSSWWADFRAGYGFEHFGNILRNRNGIVGGALVLKFSHTPDCCFYYIPEGPVLPGDESMAGEVFETVLEAIDETRKTEGQTVSHLRVEPRWQRLPGFVRGFRTVAAFADRFTEPRNTLCIDLRPSEDAILAQMKPKGRYNIRVAQRHSVTIVEDTSDRGLADFLGIYEDMTVRQGITPKPPDYFQKLVSLLSSHNQGSVFFAEYQGERLAGAVVIYFGQRATYFYGGSLDRHRHVMAPYLLHFEIMRKARALGLEWYDLWGVAPEDQPDDRWWDLSVFKRKFGGVEIKLVPALDYVYDAAAYDRYVAGERDSGDTGFRDPLSSECIPNPEECE